MSLHRRTAAVLALLAAAACGGSDEPAGPGAPDNARVATQLTQLSARLSPSSPAAAFIGIASAGLALGVQPSAVNVTVSAARGAPAPGASRSIAGSAAKFNAVGFRMIGRNVPESEGDVVINGGVMWDDALSQVVLVMGTGTATSFGDATSGDDFAIGAIHRVSPEASWLATAGTMSVGAPSTAGACPGAPMAGLACALGSFALAYDITGSMAVPYEGNGASGSRSASLATAAVNGFVLTVDYDRLGASGRRALDAAARARRATAG